MEDDERRDQQPNFLGQTLSHILPNQKPRIAECPSVIRFAMRAALPFYDYFLLLVRRLNPWVD